MVALSLTNKQWNCFVLAKRQKIQFVGLNRIQLNLIILLIPGWGDQLHSIEALQLNQCNKILLLGYIKNIILKITYYYIFYVTRHFIVSTLW